MLGCLSLLAQLLSGGQDAFSLDWAQVRFQHTAALRANLCDRFGAATANKYLSALRGVLKAAHGLGQMSSEDYTRAVQIKHIRGEALLRGRALSGEEVAELLRVCREDPSAAGARDLAIIAVLWSLGLRRSEICSLRLEDYSGESLEVHGKGNKTRLVPVTGEVALHLSEWLSRRGRTLPGALFCPVRKNGHPVIREMHPQVVFNLLKKRGKQAGLSHFSPHDLRRTFISDLLDSGADISTIQRLAGHSLVSTTARYDRRGEGVKRKAVELRSLPK